MGAAVAATAEHTRNGNRWTGRAVGAPPQVRLLLDEQALIVQVDCSLAGTRLAGLDPAASLGKTVHQAIHPHCSGCDFDSVWTKSWGELARVGTLESELDDRILGAPLRLYLNKTSSYAAELTRPGGYAELTIKDISRFRAATLRSMAAQLVAAEANERRRIAAELHDGICQSLGIIKYRLEGVIDGPNRRNVDELHGIVEQLRGAIDEVRRIATNLAPPTLDDYGILATLEGLCGELREANPDLSVSCTLEAREEAIPKPLKIVMHRVTQEAFSNIVRHSQAHRVSLRVTHVDGDIELCIEDDGRGFEPPGRKPGERVSMGLRNIRERVESTGGTLQIQSRPEAGTRICAIWREQDVGLLADKAVGNGVGCHRRNAV